MLFTKKAMTMSLREKTILGLKWSFASRIFRQMGQFIVSAVLARLLMPEDFGLLGMIIVYFGLILIFNEFGLCSALIQRKEVNEKHYSSAFWLNILFGFILFFASYLSAPLLANFYKKPELLYMIRVMSICILVASMSVVHSACLQRTMNFRALAIAESIAVLIGGIVGISFALMGKGPWSLVFQTMSYFCVYNFMLWVFSSWRPLFMFSFEAIKEIFAFGVNVMGFNIVNYFARNMDYFLIGKFLGGGPLGFYTLAYKIMLYPISNIAQTIGGVMFPAFSKIQHDLEKVRINYLKIVKGVSLFIIPLIMGLFVLAPQFIRVVFGVKWEPVIPVFRILCFCGALQSIETAVINIFRSQGRSDIHFKLQLIGTILVSILILIGLRWGIKGVAFSYSLYTFSWLPFTFHISNKLIKLQNKLFIRSMMPSVLIASIIAVVLILIKLFVRVNDLEILLFAIPSGIFVYVLLLFATKQVLINKKRIVLNI